MTLALRRAGSVSDRSELDSIPPVVDAPGSPRWLVVLAVLFTLLNVLRPLHMDDAAYYKYASHIAHQPLDPYGFEIFWNEQPQPAFEVLAPPLLPYYWAIAIRLFGEQPMLWKLWLLPFSLLLVFALDRLCRRFAPGFERPLLRLTVLSPAFLPSFNLMLDVPAQALALCALTLFLAACDRNSLGLACVAGVVAALAAQTKYTAVLAPATMLLYALLFHRVRLGATAAGVAFLGFMTWEVLMACRYGQSHFVFHLTGHSEALRHNHSLLLSLIMILGGIAPALPLMALVALKARTLVLVMAIGCVLLGYALLPCIDENVSAYLKMSFRLNRDSLIFGSLGFLLGALLAACLVRLCLLPEAGARIDRIGWFLALWLGLEVLGYFALAPYPAVRRILGIVVVGMLLVSRLASRTCPPQTWRIRMITLAGVCLGLGYYGVDLLDARAQQLAADAATERIHSSAPSTGWYVGHWGFQFYAERSGLQPVVPGNSHLHAGDWLVVPSERVKQQKVEIPHGVVEPAFTFSVASDHIPFRTTSGYYGSRTPVEPLAGPRLSVTIYRVLEDFCPAAQK